MNLKAVRPDFEIKHLREIFIQDLKKLETEGYDAIVLAAAGLKRTGLADKNYRVSKWRSISTCTCTRCFIYSM